MTTTVREIKPLTAKETVIAVVVGEGHKGPAALARLAQLGQHIAASTFETRVRDIASKLDNPHGLPPRSIIRLWASTRTAA